MGEQHRRTMDEHLQAALALVAPLQHTAQVSTRDLNDHHGIVVARDVMSAAAIPPFTNSAMVFWFAVLILLVMDRGHSPSAVTFRQVVPQFQYLRAMPYAL